MAAGDPMLSGRVTERPRGCSKFTPPGGGSPSEPFSAFGFADGVAQDLFITGWLPLSYSGGGLRLRLRQRTAVTSGAVVWRARFRRLALGASRAAAHDYRAGGQAVTTTVPSTAAVDFESLLEFTNGAQMESLAAGDHFALLIGRNGAAAGDTVAGKVDLLSYDLREI